MPGLDDLVSRAFKAIDGYYAADPSAHPYEAVERTKQEVLDKLEKLPQERLNKLNPESVEQAAQIHFGTVSQQETRILNSAGDTDAARRTIMAESRPGLELAENLEKTLPNPNLKFGRLADPRLIDAKGIEDLGIDLSKKGVLTHTNERMLGTLKNTTVDLTKLTETERKSLVDYLGHAGADLEFEPITDATKKIVIKNISPQQLVTQLEKSPVELMRHTVTGALVPKNIPAKPFIPPVKELNRLNYEAFLQGHSDALKELHPERAVHIDAAHGDLKDMMKTHFDKGGRINPEYTGHFAEKLGEHAEVLHAQEKGFVVFPPGENAKTHFEKRLRNQEPYSILNHSSTHQRELLHEELAKLKPKIVGYAEKEAAIKQIMEKHLSQDGVLFSPEKMQEAVQHLAKQEVGQLEAMITHAEEAGKTLAKVNAAKTAALGAPNAKELLHDITVGRTKHIENLVNSKSPRVKQYGVEFAQATTGHEQLESLLNKPVTPPIPAPVEAKLLEAEKRPWWKKAMTLGMKNGDDKLVAKHNALEQATADKVTAEIAFEQEKRAAQTLAFDVEQKRQKLSALQNEVTSATKLGDPALIQNAQAEALKAQKELLNAKTELNKTAHTVAERKQALNTYTKNVEKAEYAFEKHIDPKLAREAPKEYKVPTYDRLADKDKALDKRKWDLESAEGKVEVAEKKLGAVKVSPGSQYQQVAGELQAAQAAERGGKDAIDALKGRRAEAVSTAKDTTKLPAERVAAARDVAQYDKDLKVALKEQEKLAKNVSRAKGAVATAEKPIAGATEAYNKAHRATADGHYTNSDTSLNHTSPAAMASREAKLEEAAKKTAKKASLVARTETVVETVAERSPGIIGRGFSGAMERGGALMSGIAEHGGALASGIAERGGALMSGVAEHGGSILSKGGSVLSAGKGFAGNLMLAGVAGAGLLGLAAVLSTPKPPIARINRFEDDNAMAFSGGNSSVGLGGVAMPALGQQRGASNWVSRLPSMEDQMAMNGLPPQR